MMRRYSFFSKSRIKSFRKEDKIACGLQPFIKLFVKLNCSTDVRNWKIYIK
jgi:hypothetical protein